MIRLTHGNVSSRQNEDFPNFLFKKLELEAIYYKLKLGLEEDYSSTVQSDAIVEITIDPKQNDSH